MVPRFDTCVYCIVLVEGESEINPHPELRKRAGTDNLYDCNACGSRWSYDSGWQREGSSTREAEERGT
jgi:hypothetical protein